MWRDCRSKNRGTESAVPRRYQRRPSATAAKVIAEQRPASAELQDASAEVLTKRAQAKRAYAELSADGAPVSAGQLAAAAGLSASYARALLAQFQTPPPAALQHNGHRPAPADAHPEAGP
jgi:hypothetical protein